MRISVSTSFLAVVMLSLPASANIVVSLDAAGSTNVDTGTAGPGKVIDFFISEDALANDSLLSIVIDCTIMSGTFTGGTASATGAVGTPGFFAAGNLAISDVMVIPLKASIGQEFTDGMQPLSNDPIREKWFTLMLDTSGLETGTYTITATGSAFGPNFEFFPFNNELTFTAVAAVPEPGSFAAAAGLAGICFLRSRRSRRYQVRHDADSLDGESPRP